MTCPCCGYTVPFACFGAFRCPYCEYDGDTDDVVA